MVRRYLLLNENESCRLRCPFRTTFSNWDADLEVFWHGRLTPGNGFQILQAQNPNPCTFKNPVNIIQSCTNTGSPPENIRPFTVRDANFTRASSPNPPMILELGHEETCTGTCPFDYLTMQFERTLLHLGARVMQLTASCDRFDRSFNLGLCTTARQEDQHRVRQFADDATLGGLTIVNTASECRARVSGAVRVRRQAGLVRF